MTYCGMVSHLQFFASSTHFYSSTLLQNIERVGHSNGDWPTSDLANGGLWVNFLHIICFNNMFEGSDFPKSIDEEVFNVWLENGRLSRRRYNYLLIIWDEYESKYSPFYAEHRDEISEYETYKTSTRRESLVAVYDLYSESRIV
jgi:hypothetical protein